MNNTQHTPGPWHIGRDRSPVNITAVINGPALAKVYLTDPDTHKRTAEFAANAHLIAAAPELLAAAMEAHTEATTDTAGISLDEALAALATIGQLLAPAIAKAKGGAA